MSVKSFVLPSSGDMQTLRTLSNGFGTFVPWTSHVFTTAKRDTLL
jgi:hypothetical protein